MRDFPSCFGESGVQIADSSGKASPNLVTCLYQAYLLNKPCVITITWCKTMMGQGLTISIDDSSSQCLCKLDIKPWLFSKRKGSKTLEIDTGKLEIYWDLSRAKFGSGPEPSEGYYVAVLFDSEMVLLLGDLPKEAYRKTGTNPSSSSNSSPSDSLSTKNAVFIAKKEHIYGKKIYNAKARFNESGKSHDISIECDVNGLKDPCLEIRVDKKRVMQIKRLPWKFRGNQTILVDGNPIEVLWDVHSWLFGGAPSGGNAVFMFQTGQQTGQMGQTGFGFSLILYAWKVE
ncbi:hypothetical protein LUZ60_005246 [Juncus effusus]|nr:hypothetical protein LUZ60_005246 [Juncus effusus]